MTETNRRQRLHFRSWHRGTREMDLLMGSFADVHIGTFAHDELDEYEAILELIDPDLYSWITGMIAIPEKYNSKVMQLLCAHSYAKKSG